MLDAVLEYYEVKITKEVEYVGGILRRCRSTKEDIKYYSKVKFVILPGTVWLGKRIYVTDTRGRVVFEHKYLPFYKELFKYPKLPNTGMSPFPIIEVRTDRRKGTLEYILRNPFLEKPYFCGTSLGERSLSEMEENKEYCVFFVHSYSTDSTYTPPPQYEPYNSILVTVQKEGERKIRLRVRNTSTVVRSYTVPQTSHFLP